MRANRNNLFSTGVFLVIVAGSILLGLSLKQHFADKEERQRTARPTVLAHAPVMHTNTWYSNLYRSFPTEPLFALPGAYRFHEQGLSFGLPVRVGTPGTVFGSFVPWCSVGQGSIVKGVSVHSTGDWNVSVDVKESSGETWQVHLVQGSPVVYLTGLTRLEIRCDQGFPLISRGGSALLLEHPTAGRALIQAEVGEILTDAGSGSKTLISPKNRYRISLLPNADAQLQDAFFQEPWQPVLGTRLEFSQGGSSLGFNYTFETENQEGILTTLWPHHRLAQLKTNLPVLAAYETQLGKMELVRTSSFETDLRPTTLSAEFVPVANDEARTIITRALREDIGQYERETPPSGVYFRGTWLGGLASILQLTEAYAMEAEHKRAVDRLEAVLLPALEEFFYDQERGMLVATNPEFGNEKGNDHHFHYGYYLRAGAILLQAKPALRSALETRLNELALDIATTDRSSTRYPFLRNFSPYEGHSWADGLAHFGDGNNQESSSEALNAWYGLWLWGKIIGNQGFESTGQALHTLELSGTRAYWFGEENPFPAGYTHSMASIIWGGKRDYATWFSGQAMHIHGIQWLPITPASEYLASLPNHAGRLKELEQAHPDLAGHEWGDLFTAYLSYIDPARALTLLDRAAKNQALKSHGLLYHTVYRNNERLRGSSGD